MFKLKLIKLKKISEALKKLPRFLAERSFLTFLGLFFIVLLLGLAILYCSYILLVKDFDQVIEEEELLKLDIESQQRVFEEWQRKNKDFQAADFKEYPDFFNLDQE